MNMARQIRTVQSVSIDDIFVSANRRAVNAEAVGRLAQSIDSIGLQHPISIRFVENYHDPDQGNVGGAYLLVAGRHRLEAHKRLGRDVIDCVLEDWGSDRARMWEIAENLHRAELTALERSEHIAEWVRLAEKPSQVETVSKGGRGKESGVRAASRELGIEKMDAHRSVKVAALSPEAKAVAVETGLDDNQSVLIAAKKSGDDVVFLRTEHARREAEKRRKETVKLNSDTDRVISLTESEQFAEWIMARTDLAELSTIISWLEGTKPKDVIAALRRKAA
jgi:ParB/RepB/Spo0J family partition protein